MSLNIYTFAIQCTTMTNHAEGITRTIRVKRGSELSHKMMELLKEFKKSADDMEYIDIGDIEFEYAPLIPK